MDLKNQLCAPDSRLYDNLAPLAQVPMRAQERTKWAPRIESEDEPPPSSRTVRALERLADAQDRELALLRQNAAQAEGRRFMAEERVRYLEDRLKELEAARAEWNEQEDTLLGIIEEKNDVLTNLAVLPQRLLRSAYGAELREAGLKPSRVNALAAVRAIARHHADGS